MISDRDPIQSASPLMLVTAGLLSKWGFDDGGMPEEVWDVVDELREPATRGLPWLRLRGAGAA